MTVAEETGDRAPAKRRLPLWIELPIVVVVAVLLALVVKTFLVQVFFIPSGSMEETLQVGDRVAVNRLTHRIGPVERGEVVVFDGIDSFVPAEQAPQSEGPVIDFLLELGRTVGVVAPPDTVFIKRVIGVGGDRVMCCGRNGRLQVNGQPIDEVSYLYPGNAPSNTPFDVKVPEGKLWVMGDHRAASADSRVHMGAAGGGFVPEDRVLGRAFSVIWPVDRWEGLGTPAWAERMNEADPPQ